MACSARGGWDQLRSLGVSAPFARGTRITTTSGAWEAVERSPASLAANVAGELAGTSDAWYADADRPSLAGRRVGISPIGLRTSSSAKSKHTPDRRLRTCCERCAEASFHIC